MRVIAIANQKGGVGKTTTTATLGLLLAARGRRVLLIDLDPQECLSACLGVPLLDPPRPSIADVLGPEQRRLEGTWLAEARLALVPAGADSAETEVRLLTDPAGALGLREALKPLTREYDYVLLDCAPNLGGLTINGLAAAHQVLIPVQTEFLAVRRIGPMIRTIDRVRRIRPQLRVFGILPTMYSAHTLHAREVMETMTRDLAGYRILAPIPRTIRLPDAAAAGRGIHTLDPENAATTAYTALADALEETAA